MSDPVARLKRRREFLRVAAARVKAVSPGMVVQALARDDDDSQIRVGFTASRKVGNAVVRNRARRRLKALVQELLPGRGRPSTDYVLIARGDTATRPYEALRSDLLQALSRLERDARGRTEAKT
ncbi:MAG: ribonuclease P protein component [Proteobacteria bacterium]|jgi:ribonuclease P protein component|nr:ribonuclease P protein component [Pseudomonadota bacterium]MDA0951411.1 ribonuclease P protein component [Pseudomonadota bacterium]MDA1070246.1 ribonuclease P protein component [Pseudomonadota bacterium]